LCGFTEAKATRKEAAPKATNGIWRAGEVSATALKLSPVEKRRILLIDDSEITLELEKMTLEARGYEVCATSSLVAFERLLHEFKPDLILTDIHMPEVQGTDICRTLKAEYNSQDIPIVLFSSLPDHELKVLSEQVGADGYVSKEHGLEALGEKIDELVESILW
jgi:CheY-like chemotaxis protein